MRFLSTIFRTFSKKLALLLLAAAAVLTLPGGILAQAPKLQFRHINLEQGLSNSTIEAIFQDSRGFLWFGTRDGLNRYDGYEMRVFRADPQDSTTLSDGFIRQIVEDQNQKLWIATTNGLNCLAPSTNRFRRYFNQPSNPASLSHNAVSAVYGDKKGNLWVGTAGGGLNRLNRKENNFTRFTKDGKAGSLGNNMVNCLLEDRKGNFWIGTDGGLYLMNRENRTFYLFYNNTATGQAAENNKVRCLQEDLQGNIWIGTGSNGLFRFHPQQKTFEQFLHSDTDPASLSSNMVLSLMTDSKGNLWVGTINGGLNQFKLQTATFFHYQNNLLDPTSLSQRTVSSLLEDREGNLWVGTHRGGISFFSPFSEKFRLFRQGPSATDLSHSNVKAFAEAKDGTLWIGTDGGGLNAYNLVINTFRHFRYQPQNTASLGSDEVLHVMEDSSGKLWVSTWGGGLNLFDPRNGTFTRFKQNPSDPHSLSSDFVQKVVEGRNGTLWVATYYGGLNIFDPRTKQFRRFLQGSKGSISGNNIVSLQDDKDGNLWIGTDDGGLNFLNVTTGAIRQYFNQDEKFPDLRVIFFDKRGRLWIGQKGLYLFQPQTNRFQAFAEKAGLSQEFIKGIVEDEAGTLWISTNHGLTQLNPETGAFKKYNPADGLQGLEFEANAFLKTRNGEIYFGGVNGFNSFYPATLTENKAIPPVYLTGFEIFNKPVLPGQNGSPLAEDISLTKEVHLSYRQSTLSFTFAALNYTASENNRYKYKLENFDRDWIDAGTERKATYTNLPPGTYTFLVKGSNNDGMWNEKAARLNVIISPPYWETWWFKALVTLFLLVGVGLVVWQRRKVEMKRIMDEKKEEMHQMQLQFFTNISHEFRTPLSLIINPLEKLLKTEATTVHTLYKTMYRNAQRLLSLLNELMDFRKVEAGALTLKVMPGNFSLFLKEIAEDFAELAAQKNIRFTVKNDSSGTKHWFDRQVMEKVILNLLHNAFKYTPAGGSVSIEILDDGNDYVSPFANKLVIPNTYKAKQTLYLKVADSGIGISGEAIHHLFERFYRINEAHLGSGVGLAFVKSLTLLHKGSITVYSESNRGTEFIIAIPVDQNDYGLEEKWLNPQQGHVRIESIASGVEMENHPLTPTDKKERSSTEQPFRILIVDDNEELRHFLKETLDTNYQVVEAVNGRDGWQKIKDEQPDLVISDVMMPDMDGNELCQLVKQNIETSHIPFFMLTAKTALTATLEGVGAGADHYFTKPLSLDLLQLTIQNTLEQRKRLKERFPKEYFSEAKELVHSAKDKEFMEQLLQLIEAQLVNPELDVEMICSRMAISRTKLYHKIKALTGLAVGDFIRTIRLKRAAYIMTHEDVPLSEVMYRIGIQTQSYFTKAFKKEFGKTPTQFLQELKQ